MTWINYVASFFAGMFLANAVPHFVKGICGDRFSTPFAKPPGKGLSSAPVNVLWGLFNIVVGYLLFRSGKAFDGPDLAKLIFFVGAAILSVLMSVQFQHKAPQ